MRIPCLLFVAGVAAVTACNLSTDLPTSKPLGIVLITDTTDALGHSALAPVGHFLAGNGVSVPDSRSVQDSCLVVPYLADTGAFPYDEFQGIDAGAAITVQTTQATTDVPEILDLGVPGLYALPGDSTIPFTPGTPVSVSVPGTTGGFPTLAVSAATAADYTVGPIDTMPPADSFHITWSPAAGANSAMVFVLNFDTAYAGGGAASVELYCSVLDTGDALVPSASAAIWRKALPGSRGIRSYRWQTTFQSSDSAELVVIAQHNGPTTTIPAPNP